MASNGVGSLTLLALLGIVVGLLTSFTVAISSTHSIQSSVDSSSHEDGCYSHSYSTFILSKDPLVIYINSFITLDEAAHMLNLSVGKYNATPVYFGYNSSRLDPAVRTSSSAKLDRDAVVRCIEDRALEFQGWRSSVSVQASIVQRYDVGGHFQHHYDWVASKDVRGNRASTFMIYLDGNCTGGGTNFPRLKTPTDGKWCKFIDCDEPYVNGVTFKPIVGNAIFWENLHPNGSGHKDTWHAGLPVTSGSKTGLNIWSWLI